MNNPKDMPEQIIKMQFHMLENTTYKDKHKIFTDGSKTKEPNSFSAAIFIQNTNITTIWKLSKYINIREAELFAINQGLRYVQNNRLNDSVIFTDSPSALQLITNQTQKSPTNHIPHTTDNTHTDTPETKHKNTLNSIAKGIRGNEIVDKAAKKHMN